MVLSRLRFFRSGLATAVFREFGKVPERSEAFTTSKRSASKQLSILLKKKMWEVCQESRFKNFFQNFAINFFKNRLSHLFFKLRSNLCDLCITRRFANLLSDIIDISEKETNSLHVLSESISLGI